jgi:regulatory protein
VRKKNKHADDFSRALSYSFLLLKYRLRSEREILTRLKEKGYLHQITKQVVGYLKTNKYIDDKTFADEFIQYGFDKGWGVRKISFQLNKFGIVRHLSERLLSALNYKDKIRSVVQIKGKKNIDKKDVRAVTKEKARLLRILIGRGFQYEEIHEAVDEFIKG